MSGAVYVHFDGTLLVFVTFRLSKFAYPAAIRAPGKKKPRSETGTQSLFIWCRWPNSARTARVCATATAGSHCARPICLTSSTTKRHPTSFAPRAIAWSDCGKRGRVKSSVGNDAAETNGVFARHKLKKQTRRTLLPAHYHFIRLPCLPAFFPWC